MVENPFDQRQRNSRRLRGMQVKTFEGPFELPSLLEALFPAVQIFVSSPSSNRDTCSAIWSHSPMFQAALAAIGAISRRVTASARVPYSLHRSLNSSHRANAARNSAGKLLENN